MRKLKLLDLVTKLDNNPLITPSDYNSHGISSDSIPKKKRPNSMFRVNTVKKYQLHPDFTQIKHREPQKQSHDEIEEFQKFLVKDSLQKKSAIKRAFKGSKYLPLINKSKLIETPKIYYKSTLIKAFSNPQMNYFLRIYKDHFQESIKAAKIAKSFKITESSKKILLPKQDKRKTVILDLDETLVHCTEILNFNSVRLNIPLENGTSVSAGINVRPKCREALKEISSIAEIIIFTASSSTYADAVLDFLDPDHKYISHRLYRQHCTLEKGHYIKDLRNINRNLEDVVLVDNSYYSFSLQTDNGIPIIPYYDNLKDRELMNLVDYLKNILTQQNMLAANRKYFMLQRYGQPGIKKQIIKSLEDEPFK